MGRASRQVSIEGVEDLKQMVDNVNPRISRQIARSAVQAVASQVTKAMKKRVKSLSQGGGELTSVIAKAIKAKRRRGKPNEPVSDVRVEHGSGAKHDAFFWHWVEFEYGGVARTATPFIRPTVSEFEKQTPRLYREEFGKRLEKRLAKEAAKQGVKRR